jgi:L-rhamnose mutarotase
MNNTSAVNLQRVGFQLRVRANKLAEYDESHRQVWPELLARLSEVGFRNYSIFRRGQQLFLYVQVADFKAAQDALRNDPVNLRWQQAMADILEPVPDLQPGEEFAMMEEVFYMEG